MFNRACRVAKLCVKAVLRALITVEPYARIGHVRFIGGDGSRELSLPGRTTLHAAQLRILGLFVILPCKISFCGPISQR